MDFGFGDVSWQLIIQMLVSVVLPLVVGLVTKWATPSSVKAILLAALSIITSGLNELLGAIVNGETFHFGVWLVSAIGTFAVAVATHYGFWKPTTVSAAVQAIGDDTRPSVAQV